MQKTKSTYISGPIGRVMIRTALSMLVGTLAISGYNIADTYFVSRLGDLPLAAMGYTFPVVMLLGCLFRGIDTGIMSRVAQLLGGGEPEKAARMLSSGILLLGGVALFTGICGCSFIDQTFHAFRAGAEVMPMIRSYMVIWYMGSVTAALSMAGNAMLVAAGSPRSAGLMMMGGLLLNVALDPLFIFGLGPFPGMGIAGAALATVIAQALSMLAAAAFLHYRYHLIGSFRFQWRQLRAFWKQILRYAVPSTLSMLLIPIGTAVVTRAVAVTGGDLAVAAAAAGARVESVAFIFPMSLGIALMPMIAQNYGAGFYDRIDCCRKFSMKFAGIMLMIMATIYTVFAPNIASLFTDTPQVAEILVRYLRIIAWGFAGQEIHRFGGFVLTGCDHPLAAGLLNGSRVVVFLIPLVGCAVGMGSLTGIFFARLTADLVSGILAYTVAKLFMRKLLKKKYHMIGSASGC